MKNEVDYEALNLELLEKIELLLAEIDDLEDEVVTTRDKHAEYIANLIRERACEVYYPRHTWQGAGFTEFELRTLCEGGTL